VTTVAVTPATATLSAFGSTAQLTAVAKDQDGATMSDVTFSWTSSTAGVASVTTDGTVTAVANGTAAITATASGKSGTAAVTVDVKGALRIVTAATGESGALDPEGYTVSVDGTPSTVGVFDTVVVANVAPGDRTVELADVAANCTIGGVNPRTVTVVAGDTVETAFAVDCVTEVGMARWALDLSIAYSLRSAVALGDDGTIYVPSLEGIYAVHPDGTEKWRYQGPGDLSQAPAVAADGTIYAAAYFGSTSVVAINSSGALEWTYDASEFVSGTTALGADGTVYFGSTDEHLYALNPDGTVKWTLLVPESRFGVRSPSVGADGTVYVGVVDSSFGGLLVAVGADGVRKWAYPTLNGVAAAPAIGTDGTVYVGAAADESGFDGKLYAINPDGTLRWSYQTQGAIYFSAVIGPDGTVYVGSGGTQYDPDQTGTFYAINPDGSPKWDYALPGCVGGGATIGADGLIYVPTAGCVLGGTGILVVLNPDGTLAWEFEVPGDVKVISGAPALAADGTLYLVSTYAGELYALKTTSMGLASGPWPREYHYSRNTGNYTSPLP
jgi:outer membrane protein assembly factor BamB